VKHARELADVSLDRLQIDVEGGGDAKRGEGVRH